MRPFLFLIMLSLATQTLAQKRITFSFDWKGNTYQNNTVEYLYRVKKDVAWQEFPGTLIVGRPDDDILLEFHFKNLQWDPTLPQAQREGARLMVLHKSIKAGKGLKMDGLPIHSYNIRAGGKDYFTLRFKVTSSGLGNIQIPLSILMPEESELLKGRTIYQTYELDLRKPKNKSRSERKKEKEEEEKPLEITREKAVTSVYSMEAAQWEKLRNAKDTVLLKAFMTSYPNGKYFKNAKLMLEQLRPAAYKIERVASNRFKVKLTGMDQPRIAKISDNVFAKVKILDTHLSQANYFELTFEQTGPYQLLIEDRNTKLLNIDFNPYIYFAQLNPLRNSKDYELRINGGTPPYQIDFFRAGKNSVERISNIEDTVFQIKNRDLAQKEMNGRYEVRVYDQTNDSWAVAGDIVVQPQSGVPFPVILFFVLVLGMLGWAIVKHIRYSPPATNVYEGYDGYEGQLEYSDF